MKSDFGTGEVILLQTLDYFRKKVEALEGESYRADELDFCYNSLHEDYVKKCVEYNALKTSYDKLAEDYDDLSADLHQSVDDYKEKINTLEEENNELKRKHQLLKDALDLRMTECDELKSKNFILEGLIKKSNETTWGQVDDAKITNIVCGDINEVTTPISSEEADVLAYMAGWEKAGY